MEFSSVFLVLKILIFFQTLCWQKRESPQWDLNPMPLICQMSTLPLDHRGFLFCPITYPSDLLWSHWAVTNIIYKTSSAHPIHTCVTTAHLFCTSVWMAYHHLNNNEFSSVFLVLKILIFFQTLCWQKRELWIRHWLQCKVGQLIGNTKSTGCFAYFLKIVHVCSWQFGWLVMQLDAD